MSVEASLVEVVPVGMLLNDRFVALMAQLAVTAIPT
jgi:hypothetical protein